MAFMGTIPQALRQILSEHARTWDATSVYIGCSGNLTAERTLSRLGRFELHGNDITLYSCALGAFVTDRLLTVRVKPEHADEWGWLNRYLETPSDVAATMIVGAPMLRGLGRDNPYYDRMRGAYVRDWKELHAEAVEKLVNLHVSLKSFHIGDAVEWVKDVPEDAAVVCFPPFFAGDYEQMFAALSEVFSWPEPEYEELTADRRQLLLSRMQEKADWFFSTHVRQEKLEENFRGVVQTSNRGVPIYVYSSRGATRIVQPRQVTEPVNTPVLAIDEELGERLSIAVLTAGQFAMMRSQFMNKTIKPGSASVPCAVLVDGKLVGVFAYSTSPTLANHDPYIQGPQLYLLSDFPIAPTRYTHLAKLVLVAALSKEGRLLAERYSNRRWRSLVTTANTNRPVSMKYRGAFKLMTRRDYKGDEGWKFQLNYGAELGHWSLDEGLAIWKQRWGKVSA